MFSFGTHAIFIHAFNSLKGPVFRANIFPLALEIFWQLYVQNWFSFPVFCTNDSCEGIKWELWLSLIAVPKLS